MEAYDATLIVLGAIIVGCVVSALKDRLEARRIQKQIDFIDRMIERYRTTE